MNGRFFWLWALLGAVTVGFICYLFRGIFTPLALALFAAYLLDPAVTRLTALGLPRPPAIGLVFTLLCLGSLILGWYWSAAIKGEFSTIQLNLPAYATRLYEVVPDGAKVSLGIETPARVQERAGQLLEQLKGTSLSVIREAASVVTRAFASTLSFVLTLFGYLIIPVYLYYLLRDFPLLRSAAPGLVPVRYRDTLQRLAGEANTVLAAFVRGQLLVCLILALLYSVGLMAIGIELAVVIGSISGLLFIVPYIGTLIGIILSVIMAFLKFHDLLHPLLCIGWFGLVQFLEGSVITPRIVGTTVGLHPVVIILALLFFGQVGGLLGMLVAVPLTAVLNLLLRELVGRYRRSSFFLEES